MPGKKGLFAPPPPVTLVSIAVLFAVFMADYLIFVPAGVRRFGFAHLMMGEDPGIITQALCLRTSAVLRGQVWRVLSSMLLHGGLLHLLGNCAALWVAGGLVEREIGGARFGLTLLCGGVFANICVMRVCGNEFGYGASLAIYGALGLLAALWLTRRAAMRGISTRPQRILLLVYILLNVAADPNTLVEHGGGFIAGIGLVFIFRMKEAQTCPDIKTA